MRFSRQEFWSGLPCPPPGDLPSPGIEPVSLKSPALAGRFFMTSAAWEAQRWDKYPHIQYHLHSYVYTLELSVVCLLFLFCISLCLTAWELPKTKTFVTEVSLTMHALCLVHSKYSGHIDETSELMGILTHEMDGWVDDRKVTICSQARYHLSLIVKLPLFAMWCNETKVCPSPTPFPSVYHGALDLVKRRGKFETPK